MAQQGTRLMDTAENDNEAFITLLNVYGKKQAKRLMDTVENDNEAFINQLTVYGRTRYEIFGYCLK